MPYITKDGRDKLDGRIAELGFLILDVGELNYVITNIIQVFLGNERRYADYNEVVGALECAKFELYRRQISKYEDKKKRENGDVF